MERALKSPVKKEWKVSDANLFLSQKSSMYHSWNDGHGYPATQIYLSCANSGLNWVLMLAVACVTSDYFRKTDVDFFACGMQGSFHDQVINGAIAWQGLESLDVLKLNESQHGAVNRVAAAIMGFLEGMAAQRTREEPLPPEPAPQPTPTIPDTTPVPVRTWWDCPKCRENNPPLRETCIKCRTKRPGQTPSNPTKPDEPATPTTPTIPVPWKTKFKWVGMAASSVLSLWFVVKFLPIPATVLAAIETVLRLLKEIFG